VALVKPLQEYQARSIDQVSERADKKGMKSPERKTYWADK
jgi:hypothetical protein